MAVGVGRKRETPRDLAEKPIFTSFRGTSSNPIEKMYPRQNFYQQTQKKVVPKVARGSPIKMKPKPSGLDFEEVNI